jgi:replicative DNA helicase
VNDRREIPIDLIAEEALLGACLLSRAAIESTSKIVMASEFHRPLHQRIYAAILLLFEAGEQVDIVSVAASFTGDERQTAIETMHRLQNEVPAISAADRYAAQVLHTAKHRALIYLGSDIIDAGYDRSPAPAEVAESFSKTLADHELLRRHEGGNVVGYYPDIGTVDTGEDRDAVQPWIARGVLRRQQRLLVVAKAGLGKSTFLRQLAFCAVNGVHPLTEQATERPRKALIVELEAGLWDIASSMRDILLPLRRAKHLHSAFDLERPALLHRPGGIDLRSPDGRAALELAIQRAQPELVVMGPIKYMSSMKPGENYETAALALHGILNDMMAKYRFALAMEAHFSRGDHGAPGGSERWVDWPDVGFGIHPPDDCATPPPPMTEMTMTQFRNPRDGGIYIPPFLLRGARQHLPWIAVDHVDPARTARSAFTERYGAVRQVDYQPFEQADLVNDNA